MDWIEEIKNPTCIGLKKNNKECNQHWIDEIIKEYNLNVKTNSNLHWTEKKECNAYWIEDNNKESNLNVKKTLTCIELRKKNVTNIGLMKKK